MGGGDVGTAFEAALTRTGTSLTSKNLVDMYPLPSSLTEESPIDLKQCKFFDLFDADPAQARVEMDKKRQEAEKLHGTDFMQQVKRSKHHHPLKKRRQFDFRLTSKEKEKLAATGVVASQRMQAESFAEIYYRLYSDDLPVFVTTDSILHAWHRSFDAFLIKLESNYLAPMLEKILKATLSKYQEMYADNSTVKTYVSLQGRTSSVSIAVEDVRNYLTLGLSLLQGELQQQCSKLKDLWVAVAAEQTIDVELFSCRRTVDFSLFKPRGHYNKSEDLKRYFRAMMWLGTIDCRIAGGEHQHEDLHQLLCAVVLVQCLQASGSLDEIESVNSLISCLVADNDIGADSLSAHELARFVISTKVATSMLANISFSEGTLSAEGQQLLIDLQQQIVKKGVGTQFITGHPLVEDVATGPPIPTTRPVSFALLGQRFVWSAFILTRLVYDQVVQNEAKPARRIPSAVDVAFSLFGNSVAASEIARRVKAHAAGPNNARGDELEFISHRDGIDFSSNLIALRQVIDEEFDDSDDSTVRSTADQEASISTLWLRALRALSRPSPNAGKVFHSKTWQYRQMNTQIASFAQLRHDTVLYAKQSYTCMTRCEYPDGIVDPYPMFWQRMEEMAHRMKEIACQVRETFADTSRDRFWIDKGCQVFEVFASTMKTLEEIVQLQIKGYTLNEDHVRFMKSVMEQTHGSGATKYNGWYPQLFYVSPKDSGKRDVVVVDIHTDTPSVEHSDPGGILHLGVGDPVVGFFVVNDVMYAGPLFSSYEFVTPIDKRLSDEDFQENLSSMTAPKWAQCSYICSESSTDAVVQAKQDIPHWERQSCLH